MALSALLGGASGILGGVASYFDGKANRKMQRELNANDKKFALEQWERENAYNNPKAQMERLKAGGLNPNLVYGNGATTTSAHMNPPDSKPLPPINTASIGQGIQQGIHSYVDLRQQKLQNDLLALQVVNQAQDVALKAKFGSDQKQANLENTQTRTYATEIGGRLQSIGMKNAQQLSDISVQHASQVLNNLGSTGKGIELDNTRKAIEQETLSDKNKLVLQDLVSRIENNKANKTRTQVETELQTMRKQLRKDGIETSDNLIMRLLHNMFSGNSDGKIYNNTMDLIKGKK